MQDLKEDRYGRCVLHSKCKDTPCGNDVYILHGYRENSAEEQMDTITMDSDDRNIYHCYLPYVGCGYDIPCIMETLEGQIEEHSSGKKVDLMGLSFGGMISQLYAKERPDTVDKLVLVSSFSKIHDSYAIMRSLIREPKYTKKIMEYDLSHLRDSLLNETFALNCLWDNIFIGHPPKVNKSYIMGDCMHHHRFFPDRIKDKIKEFLAPSAD